VQRLKASTSTNISDVLPPADVLEMLTEDGFSSSQSDAVMPHLATLGELVMAAHVGSGSLLARFASQVSQKRSLDDTLSFKQNSNAASYPASTANGHVKLDGRQYHVTGNQGSNPIVIFFHGNTRGCTGMCTDNVVSSLSGYTVVAPCDKTGDLIWEIWNLKPWAEGCYKSVKAWLGPRRRIGAVGFSMGGAAAITLTYKYPSTPTVAMHPAHVLTGFSTATGPILFTSGSKDTMIGCDHGGIRNKFEGARGVKRFVLFTDTNSNHDAACVVNRPENSLAKKWMDCYLGNSGPSGCECSRLGLSGMATCT